MKQFLVVLGVFLLAVPAFAGEFIQASGSYIENEYIVVFNTGTSVANVAQTLAGTHGANVARQWNIIPGVLMKKLPPQAAQAIAQSPFVKYVEANGIMKVVATQSPATWGLDRIDQRALPLGNSYTYNYDGTGVHAYILDTGCRMTHNEFGGRFGNGYDFIDNDSDPSDCHGHGTHVAGTVGGATYGVAKNVTLHAVRVLDCQGSGTYAQIIDGINWVTNNFIAPAVANMSLGGSASQSVDDAIDNSVQAGVFYAVAAGNNYAANACNYSPAGADEAFTVAASDSSDARASFSNIGPCVDIYAPGASITSASNSCDTCTTTMSGTSMASPHVCGAGALIRDEFPAYNVDQVKAEILDRRTCDVISDAGASTTDDLLFTLDDGGDPNCEPCVPTEDPEVSCSDGIDNDCDGLIDGDDPDCNGCVPTEDPEVSCSDGVDNDCDGLIDGDDPDCAVPCKGPWEWCSSNSECCSGICFFGIICL